MATELATFAISASKHGGKLWMNFSFIWKTSLQIQDVWKDGQFFKWLLSNLDQKIFQELVFKAVKNRIKMQWLVDRQQIRSICQPKAAFLQYKVILFETTMATTTEVNRDKTKVPD